MKHSFYKVILYLFKILTLIKRGVGWFFSVFWSLVVFLSNIIRSTLGVKFYKWRFKLNKILPRLRLENKGLVGVLGTRAFLQILFLFIALIIALPHSKLYTKDISGLSGRDTVLYSLVGPGEQNFEIEEVKANFTYHQPETKNRWAQGAISVETYRTTKSSNLIAPGLVVSGVGGVVKPSITPKEQKQIESIDSENKTKPKAESNNRKDHKDEVRVYSIKSGDTLYSLSNRFGINIDTLVWANDISRRSYLQPGDQLKILPVSGVLHKVSTGDTVGEIARAYNAEIEDIIEFNDIQGGGIQVGQQLIVPHGEKGVTRSNTSRSRNQSEKTRPQQDEQPSTQTTRPAPTKRSGSGYIWPTQSKTITQYFGWRHSGLDIADQRGAALYAARSGRVVKSECGWNGGYGCYVVLEHQPGIRTLYAHAYKLYVQRGQRVKQGESIAAMGSTGRSTGPHVHFEVRINGRRKNPIQYIR